ncbi:DUF2807 domain-containing protein [Cellulophaga baltica]|uniref:head GIN domain-containing protein n=1 Tax=Cellulophaga TaxID=104264 RepID=UPI001C065CD4|nr:MULTISPECIES: head GIN domain-containing protein [Cellulophaga]MBU2997891.1 DUF2807 domain-containing protein [Cellulophaga baltica]MDO6769292.1 head GIN domain-containing protein [Cellulophaga sp. 1_MG-2023]
MTALIRIAIAFALSAVLTSCGFDINIGDFSSGEKGNGVVTTSEREISEKFTKITSSEGLDVYVTQADEFNISVEADENIIELIGTDISNNTLKIHAIKNIGNATKKIYVSLPEITSLKSSSGSILKVENTITGSNLDIDSSSGSILKATVNVENLDLEASSGSNIKLSGTTNTSTIDASSGANIKASDLTTEICDAEASSGANVSIFVSKSLTADASSGGNISYSGDAKVSKNKSVSGSISFND